jgi:hypothetical protein
MLEVLGAGPGRTGTESLQVRYGFPVLRVLSSTSR